MSPLSLYRHLLARPFSLSVFLRHLLLFLLPFLPPPPPPPMENPKEDPNPNSNPHHAAEEEEGRDEEEEVVIEEEDDSASESSPRPRPSRTPFTSLSQVDADLALARTLQEQERAYMMLRMSSAGGSRGGSDFVEDFDESGSEYQLHYEDGDDQDHPDRDHGSIHESDYDEDAFDAQDLATSIDPAAFNDDEAYARALQEAEEREVAVRLMSLAGINDWVAEDREDHGSNSQDTWLEVDPDELSYEELVALGEAVGTEGRGLSADTIASLPSVNYKAQSAHEGSNDQCVICRLDYEDGDSLTLLSCKHTYHSECVNKWLQINKVCPFCSAEVSTENRQG